MHNKKGYIVLKYLKNIFIFFNPAAIQSQNTPFFNPHQDISGRF
jgi:hypothetical protein